MHWNRHTPASTGLTQNADSVICLNSPYPNPDPVTLPPGKKTPRFATACTHCNRLGWGILVIGLWWAVRRPHLCLWSNLLKHGPRGANVHLLVGRSFLQFGLKIPLQLLRVFRWSFAQTFRVPMRWLPIPVEPPQAWIIRATDGGIAMKFLGHSRLTSGLIVTSVMIHLIFM